MSIRGTRKTILLVSSLIGAVISGIVKADTYEFSYSLHGDSTYHYIAFNGESVLDSNSYRLFTHHLRDRYTNEISACEPRLAITLAELYKRTNKHIIIHSGFRSLETNRREKIGGANQSQHLQCSAVDFELPGYSAELTAIILTSVLDDLWGDHLGGVGVYENTVHLDTGRRRFWKK